MAQAVFWRRDALVAFSMDVRDEGVAILLPVAVLPLSEESVSPLVRMLLMIWL